MTYIIHVDGPIDTRQAKTFQKCLEVRVIDTIRANNCTPHHLICPFFMLILRTLVQNCQLLEKLMSSGKKKLKRNDLPQCYGRKQNEQQKVQQHHPMH